MVEARGSEPAVEGDSALAWVQGLVAAGKSALAWAQGLVAAEDLVAEAEVKHPPCCS